MFNIGLILLLFQEAAKLLGETSILDGLGVGGPVGWGIHYYYMRRENKALRESRQRWKDEADKYQGYWVEANKALISHGHEATGTYQPYQQQT